MRNPRAPEGRGLRDTPVSFAEGRGQLELPQTPLLGDKGVAETPLVGRGAGAEVPPSRGFGRGEGQCRGSPKPPQWVPGGLRGSVGPGSWTNLCCNPREKIPFPRKPFPYRNIHFLTSISVVNPQDCVPGSAGNGREGSESVLCQAGAAGIPQDSRLGGAGGVGATRSSESLQN